MRRRGPSVRTPSPSICRPVSGSARLHLLRSRGGVDSFRKARNTIRRSPRSAMVRVTSATERPSRSIAVTTTVSPRERSRASPPSRGVRFCSSRRVVCEYSVGVGDADSGLVELTGLEPVTPTLPGASESCDQAVQLAFCGVGDVVGWPIVVTVVVKIVVTRWSRPGAAAMGNVWAAKARVLRSARHEPRRFVCRHRRLQSRRREPTDCHAWKCPHWRQNRGDPWPPCR